jgi:hypothetical protein
MGVREGCEVSCYPIENKIKINNMTWTTTLTSTEDSWLSAVNAERSRVDN